MLEQNAQDVEIHRGQLKKKLTKGRQLSFSIRYILKDIKKDPPPKKKKKLNTLC